MVTFKNTIRSQAVNKHSVKLVFVPKWRKWPTYLSIGDGYIRHFKKILPFILKARVRYILLICLPNGYAGSIQH